MRGLLSASMALLLVGCATNREALQPPAAPAATPAVARHAAGPLPAHDLARNLGLQYRDVDSHVLLSDQLTRVRIWKDSDELSVDGQTVHLGARALRRGRALILPTTMVSYVEAKVGEQRSRFAMPVHRPRPRVVAPALVLPTLPEPKETVDVARKPVPAAEPAPRALPPADPAWEPAVASRAWRWIVIHHSDDTRGDLARYDRIHRESKGWDECGYHFVVGNGSLSGDGQVEIGSRWFKQKHGAHAKTPDNRFNDYGIGICLVGDFELCGRPTAAQMDSLVRLCAWLMTRYDIPLSSVLGHDDCKPTACPGRMFPWGELRSRLQAAAP